MLHPGLYEQVINNALTGELAEIPEARKSVAPIDKVEASKVLAQYLADVVQKGLDNVLDIRLIVFKICDLKNRIRAGVDGLHNIPCISDHFAKEQTARFCLYLFCCLCHDCRYRPLRKGHFHLLTPRSKQKHSSPTDVSDECFSILNNCLQVQHHR